MSFLAPQSMPCSVPQLLLLEIQRPLMLSLALSALCMVLHRLIVTGMDYHRTSEDKKPANDVTESGVDSEDCLGVNKWQVLL